MAAGSNHSGGACQTTPERESTAAVVDSFPRISHGTKIGPVLQCSQGLVACRAVVAVEAQKNPPCAGRGGPEEYSMLHWRTMPQDACANESVDTTSPKIKSLPAAIREGE